MKNSIHSIYFLACFLLFGSFFALAQSKQPMDHHVYEIWSRINENAISNDGEWALYSYGPENGDPTLVVKHISSGETHQVARGTSAKFSADARYAAFKIVAAKAAVKAAKQKKTPKEKMPKDSLGILNTGNGALFYAERVKSFKFPEENGAWLAYLLEEPLASAADSSDTTAAKSPPEKPESPPSPKKDASDKPKKKKAYGSELVLRNLEDGSETRISHVLEYIFSKDGRWLVYSAASKDSSADGVFAIVVNTGEQVPVLSGSGDYKKIVFDEKGEQIAFISNRDDFSAETPAYKLYHWPMEKPLPTAVAGTATQGLPANWSVSEHGNVYFSDNGERLFFATAPFAETVKKDSIPEDEKVVLDIWHWQDPYIQTMQLKDVEKEKKRNYLAVVQLNKKQVFQLASEAVPDVTVGSKGDADVAIGMSNMPYRREVSWDYPSYYDVHLINMKTGRSERVLEKIQSQAQLSPAATYFTWWDRKELSWKAMDVKRKTIINLSDQIPFPVYDENHDWPYPADAYGNAGWTEKDGAFLVYDRHDLWQVDPTGKTPINCLTDTLGRKENLRFRYRALDPEIDYVPAIPILLAAFHWDNKTAGFYQDQLGAVTQPEKLVLTGKHFSRPLKAKNSSRLMFTRQDFQEFPDLWVSGPTFAAMTQVSDVNPQQSEYFWGSSELIEWTALDGQRLQGLLYKPENFDPSQKYPTMVTFYEKSSHELYRYAYPGPHRSVISPSFYTSRGYVVFEPDIPYRIGYPGESALNSVIPGVTNLISQGFIDKDNIGVMGHSWAGYQIAYLVTRSNIFKAAEAGAPVANMISAYGGIRWRTGLSRMFQYERTQSRIGGTLWEYPMRYFENSPIFWLDKVETPLLILHNDHDGAVPWYQGIELFVGLRRLGKPAWMINYNNEPHWPVKYHNKVDWQTRLQQYFDYYLKGAPAPLWLEKGIPAIQKGKTLGLEAVETSE